MLVTRKPIRSGLSTVILPALFIRQIDGIAIPGVSGGPVIFSSSADGVQFVGMVSAYRSSRASGETTPGLLIAQDVSHVHTVIQQIKSWDEA
jgi:hypothetical protein